MKIELVVGDTNAQEKNAMAAAFRHVQLGSVAFIGPGTSGRTIPVSRWLSLPSIDRTIIGFAATSSQLSKKEEFSNFVRTIPNDDTLATLMAELMNGLLVGKLYVL